MRATATCDVALGLLFVGLASSSGCSSNGAPGRSDGGGGAGAPAQGAAGGAGATTAGAAGTQSGAGGDTSGAGGQSAVVGGGAGEDGNVAADGGDPETSDAGAASDAAGFGYSITVAPTAGCGVDAGQAPGTTVPYTIATSGTKPATCADKVCGPWMYTRQYFLTLPSGYDPARPYALVFEGVGCGGTGAYVYTLNSLNNKLPADDNVDNTVIRVGLTPPPNAIGHATRPNQGCFDYADGDNSVDWVFYETLYDHLAGQLCFDTNRVFVVGSTSGGAPFSNELGCKYAGDATRPIRGMMATAGGLPADATALPTCSSSPMAGMWVAETQDGVAPFTAVEASLARAMKVNGCTLGTGFLDAPSESFPIGAGNPDSTCKRISGCPDLTPLVVCALPGIQHTTNDAVANPGFSAFIKLLENPPLLTQ
jgi:poly(3-hydroxybutyrate) depolymerase